MCDVGFMLFSHPSGLIPPSCSNPPPAFLQLIRMRYGTWKYATYFVLMQRWALVYQVTVRGRCWWISRAQCITRRLWVKIWLTSSVTCFHLISFHPRYLKILLWTRLLARPAYKAAWAVVMVKYPSVHLSANRFFSHSSQAISVLFILSDSPT